MKLIDILVEELPKRGGWPEGVSKISSTSCGRVFFDGQSPHGFTLPVASDAWDSHKHPFSYTNVVTREQYEAALAAKNDGWIEWGGGKHPPVSTNTVVDVKLEKGYVQSGYPAGEYSWEHIWQGSNIIAYRLHSTQGAEQAKADEEADLNECIGQDAAPVWNGDGLPPVGCECEYKWQNDRWRIGKVCYISKHTVLMLEIFDGEESESAYGVCDVTFRPIRTEAEQKREESLRVIYEILDAGTSTKQDAADIYDAIAAGEIPGVKLED